jgi:hypothetical protein
MGLGREWRTVEDLRERRRFSMHLPIRCRWIDSKTLVGHALTGESVNISSKAIVFNGMGDFKPGQAVEVLVDWPLTLDNGVRLTLVVEGVVVDKRLDHHTVMRIDRYQFKTRAGVAERRQLASAGAA